MDFLSNIWDSVFTPGTNSSLRTATYVSFAGLQLTFFALLVLTRSWHFVFLSLICGVLWACVVWFVDELEKVQAIEKEGERLRQLRKEQEQERMRVRDSEKTTEAVGEAECSPGESTHEPMEPKKER